MSKRVDELRIQRKVKKSKAARTCGTCTACCTTLGVEEIGKLPHVDCAHIVEKGCGIYDDRPPSCKAYFCLWRGGLLDGVDRPDRLGIVFDFSVDDAVFAREIVPGAVEREREKINALADSLVVVILRRGELFTDETRTIRGPAKLVAAFAEKARRRLPVLVDD